jgi:hypothetical protein
LRDGVTPLFGVRDLIFENVNTTLFVAEKYEEIKQKVTPQKRQKIVLDKVDKYLTDETDLPDISNLEGGARLVAQMIEKSPGTLNAEDISLETDLDVLDIIDILTELEIGGYVERGADGRYVLKSKSPTPK